MRRMTASVYQTLITCLRVEVSCLWAVPGRQAVPFIQRMTKEWKFDFGRVIDCDAQTLLLS